MRLTKPCVPTYEGVTLAQRTYDDLGRHMAHDTSAPMDIGQENGVKGKGEKGKKRKGKGKKDNGEAKRNAQTDDSDFAGDSRYCGKWRHKKTQCKKQKKDHASDRDSSSGCKGRSNPIVPVRWWFILDICCERLE